MTDSNENKSNIYPILISTLGRRDVQLVVEVNGEKKRLEIPFRLTREVHTLIINNPDKCTFYKGDLLKPVNRKDGDLKIDDDKLYFNDEELKEIILYPGLLLKIPDEIKNQSGIYPKSIILLNTNRDKLPEDDKIYKEEPYGAGLIISRWLNEILNLDIYEGDINLNSNNRINLNNKVLSYDYIKDDESFTSWTSKQNNIFHNRIDKLFYSITIDNDEIDNNTVYHIYTSTTGGIPLMNESVRASSIYRFHGENIKLYYVDKDERKDKVESIDQTEIVNPIVSLSSRRYSERLISEGNFSGAFESLLMIGYKKQYPEFIQNTKLVSEYFQGHIPAIKQSPEYLKKIIDLGKNYNIESIHIALLTESQMRQDNLLAALMSMFSFGESLIVDLIGKMPFVKDLVRGGKRVTIDNNQLDDDGELEEIFETAEELKLFQYICNTQDAYSFNSYLSKNEWLDLMQELTNQNKWSISNKLINNLSNFIKPLINNDTSIKKLGLPKGINNLYFLRNTYTHNMRLIIKDKSIKHKLLKYLNDKKIIEIDNNNKENSFLKSPYIKTIFKYFIGIDDISILYEELKDGLIEDIRKADIE